MAKGYEFGQISDPFLADTVIDLQHGNIVQGQICKALAGEEYFYFDSNRRKQFMPACEQQLFWYYYEIFDNCENFGLPHGKGWLAEQQWLLDFVRIMRQTKEYIYGRSQTNDQNKCAKSS